MGVLKENQFGFDSIVIQRTRGPKRNLELIKNYIDHNKMYEQAMSKKLGMFYKKSLGWSRG